MGPGPNAASSEFGIPLCARRQALCPGEAGRRGESGETVECFAGSWESLLPRVNQLPGNMRAQLGPQLTHLWGPQRHPFGGILLNSVERRREANG